MHTQKVLIKIFRPSKKYPSRDTVPLTCGALCHVLDAILSNIWPLYLKEQPNENDLLFYINNLLIHKIESVFFRVLPLSGYMAKNQSNMHA